MGLIDKIKPGHVARPSSARPSRPSRRWRTSPPGRTQVRGRPGDGRFVRSRAQRGGGRNVPSHHRATDPGRRRCLQKWFNGQATLTPTEAVLDADVAVPVVGRQHRHLRRRRVQRELTYDTDAGKTYVAAETVGFTTAVANVFGVAVTVSGATFLDTIVA